MQSEVVNNIHAYSLKSFHIETLIINSKFLKNNKLKDKPLKYNLVLKPKGFNAKKKYKCMVVLAGFTGTASKYFSYKPFQQNYPQTVDSWFAKNKINDCVILFVDAMTYWGGSQFINSPLVGDYEGYIVKELFTEFKTKYNISDNAKDTCITGGSSGGYGALHLGSKYPQLFGKVAAIAPDCDFKLSLLPELYKGLPLLEKMGGISAVKKEIKQERFFNRRDSHLIINIIAMAYCYSNNKRGEPKFPFNVSTGELDKKIWKEWLKKDPIQFLSNRKEKVEKLKGIYLDVGKYDQFNLQYGARKLNKILKAIKVPFKYTEFNGNHFDISKRREHAWEWFLK